MIRRIVCVGALLGVGSVPARPAEPAPQGQFDSLIKSSPFGQAAPVSGPQTGATGPLEFRGVFQDKGEYYFSLHEAASRVGSWVSLKETGQPYVVESYDPDKGSIQVKYRGQALTLSLKLAQVIVQAPPPMVQQAPGTTNITAAGPAGVIGSPVSGDEAQRLAQVAEEIRRRRALRAPPGAQGSPLAAPGNQPRPATTNIRP